jgi:uncharacterized cysteine cluster protein YcgN (CxxCxxCC family)
MMKLKDNEWEELCDGCGRCCGLSYGKPTTGLACPGLDTETNRCTVYEKRLTTHMCLKVTPENTLDLHKAGILPDSCAYVRHMQGKEPLDIIPVATLVPFALAPRAEKVRYWRAEKKWLKELKSRPSC